MIGVMRVVTHMPINGNFIVWDGFFLHLFQFLVFYDVRVSHSLVTNNDKPIKSTSSQPNRTNLNKSKHHTLKNNQNLKSTVLQTGSTQFQKTMIRVKSIKPLTRTFQRWENLS